MLHWERTGIEGALDYKPKAFFVQLFKKQDIY